MYLTVLGDLARDTRNPGTLKQAVYVRAQTSNLDSRRPPRTDLSSAGWFRLTDPCYLD